MSITKKISLNSDLSSFINNLTELSQNVKNLPNDICKEASNSGIVYLSDLYASRTPDPNIIDIQTSLVTTKNGYKIVASGKDVVYEEFGTGDEGANDGHPWKGQTNFKLNSYNSGETIREANESSALHGITSGKYWTYKKEGSNEVQYTQGVPAGKELFNTSNYLHEEIKKISKKKVSDVLSKV